MRTGENSITEARSSYRIHT